MRKRIIRTCTTLKGTKPGRSVVSLVALTVFVGLEGIHEAWQRPACPNWECAMEAELSVWPPPNACDTSALYNILANHTIHTVTTYLQRRALQV